MEQVAYARLWGLEREFEVLDFLLYILLFLLQNTLFRIRLNTSTSLSRGERRIECKEIKNSFFTLPMGPHHIRNHYVPYIKLPKTGSGLSVPVPRGLYTRLDYCIYMSRKLGGY